jgi:hypothetical protein
MAHGRNADEQEATEQELQSVTFTVISILVTVAALIVLPVLYFIFIA